MTDDGAERGAVLVIVAILLPVLFGFAALALDVGNWYIRAQREQKAADAAALAGSVYLPADPSKAYSVALDVASRNGFPNGGDITVTATQDAKPSRLRVTISAKQDNFFGSFLGLVSTTINRTAVGEYEAPVPMGSPANNFGNEPVGAGDKVWSNTYSGANQPAFWANIAGPRSVKSKGDAHQAGKCSFEDACSAGTNADYSPNGYFYAVRVETPPAGKKLVIQAFDPAFVNVGDHCDNGKLSGATSSSNPFVTDPATRYAANDGPFCTGDNLFTDTGDGQPVLTTFVVRRPTPTPWDPTSAPPITGCTPQFPGYNEALAGPLNGSGGDAALQQVFRRWVSLCTIDAPVAGDYLVQVRTNVRLGSDPAGAGDPTTPGEGHNRFALRAAFVDGAGNPDGANLRMFATTTMSMYVNATSASTRFHLVRVLPGSAGRVLALSFFDIGDASQPGNLRIVDHDGNAFANCTGSGPQTGSLSSCVVNATSAFNGKWERVSVPIPSGYTCNVGDPNDCWVKIQYDYGGGTIPSDTTTWSASIEGDPVRLVE